jgi:hypothetical protein
VNFIGVDAKDKGFALKLRSLAFDDTLKINLNKKDIAIALGISQPTLRKKLKNIEMFYNDGFVAEYFPVYEKCFLSKENIEVVKMALSNDKTSRVYKQVRWFLQNGFHLRRDADDRLRDVFAGVIGRKRTVVKKAEKAVFEW